MPQSKTASKNAKKRANKKKTSVGGGDGDDGAEEGGEEGVQAAAEATANLSVQGGASQAASALEAGAEGAGDDKGKKIRALQKKLRQVRRAAVLGCGGANAEPGNGRQMFHAARLKSQRQSCRSKLAGTFRQWWRPVEGQVCTQSDLFA